MELENGNSATSIEEDREYYLTILNHKTSLPSELCVLISDFLTIKMNRGDKIECLDPFDKWYVCTVLKTKAPNRIQVHYCGWSLRWDEWLNLDPDQQNIRVANLGCNTDGTPHSCQHAHCQAARITMIDKLKDMNFDPTICIRVLMDVGPDIERIINWILDNRMFEKRKDEEESKDEYCYRDDMVLDFQSF